jgi:branched-chain amino acid transport system ATP-binding protein
MIQLLHITAGYGDKVVLDDITAAFDPSKITVIMGPNGCGKTTLLKTMMGLLRPMNGGIEIDSKPFAPSPMDWIQHGVFMIGQGQRVFPNMSVRDNIEIAAHYWPSRAEFPARLDKVLKHFPDLRTRLDDMAGNLSGGQQQMVALARGLINRPKLLLLDEPSIGLAPKLISDTFHKLREINKKTGTGFIIVEHNLKTLLPLTDNAIILSMGKIAYDGPSDGKTLAKMLDKIF